MSSAAATAAVRVPGPRRPGRHLASVPAAGQPSDGGLGDALRLGRGMRLRLLAAVRALLADPSVAGLKDAPKLATVVLYAKSRAPRGEKNDLQTSIWGAELGRWLGVKESTVHHKVLPVLRGSGAARTRVVTDAKGHPTGLDCVVMPLWNAHRGGGAGHPLALSKTELAVLLRLIEALFGHGWAPENKEPTPPGLLAGRTGKGAATDRLGLLLMVLNSRASGWLQLCGGSVKVKEGRGAATLARLLGCSPSGARKVMVRLTEAGVVARQRKETSTRMNGRGRVMLLPVARAYGRTLASAEAVQGPGTALSARPDGAFGDHGPAGADGALGASALCGAEDTEDAADQERPDGAELHADHASVVTPVVDLQLSGGFSGEGRGGEGRRPERVCVREDQAVGSEDTVAAIGSPVPEGHPLGGEMPKESAAIPMEPERQEQAADGGDASKGQDAAARLLADLGGRHRAGLRGRVPRPRRDLQAVLAPVEALWDRLERRGARSRVEQAARCELGRVKRWLSDHRAEAYLARRLTRRLTTQPDRASGVKDPVGWLLERGLPRRSDCTDERCDEGVLMHSGAACERCEDHTLDLRGRRRRIADQVHAGMPDATPRQQYDAFEDRLREAVNADAERDEKRRREQEAARATAEAAEAAKARARRAAQAKAQSTLPCEECHEPMAGGLCPVCRDFRATEKLIEEAVTAIAAGCGEPDSRALTATLANSAEAEARTRIQDTCVRFEAAGATDVMIAIEARLTAKGIVHEYTTTALRTLANGLEATAEADRAHAAQMRRRHLHSDPEAAQEAAAEEALKARQRTAKHLLDTRSKAWRAAQTPAPAEASAPHGLAAAYATGAAQARTATAHTAAADCPRPAWKCTGCGCSFIGDSPDSTLCAPCDGKAAGLSRAERFALLAGTPS